MPGCLFTAGAALLLALTDAVEAVTSEFDESNEGWTIVSHSSSTDPRSPAGVEVVRTDPAVSNGSLVANDISDGWNWLRAPAKFHGDWSCRSAVNLDITLDAAAPIYAIRFFMTDGTNWAAREWPHAAMSGGARLNLTIPLAQAEWTVNGNWTTLTRAVSDFYIRVDLHNEVVGEVHFVHRVVLSTELLPLSIKAVGLSGGKGVELRFVAPQGYGARLQGSPDLLAWSDEEPVITGANQQVVRQFPVVNPPGRRFFRVLRCAPP